MTSITAAGSALMEMVERLASVTAHTLAGTSEKQADEVQEPDDHGDQRERTARDDGYLRACRDPAAADSLDEIGLARRTSQERRSALRAGRLVEGDDLVAVRARPAGRFRVF